MTAELQREIERVLAEMRDIRFAHLVVKPVLTMPAKGQQAWDELQATPSYVERYRQEAQERNATQQCADGSWW